MGLRERLDRIENPWIANSIVFAAFLLFVAICFGAYWLYSGGREKMVSPQERDAVTSDRDKR